MKIVSEVWPESLRRRALAAGGLVTAMIVVGGSILGQRAVPSSLPLVTVYKDPSCSCCRAWIDRMRASGFQVRAFDIATETARRDIKRQQGVPPALSACHTAVVGGYVMEGHVPPALVAKVLAEHPAIVGLAVPGMPAGSPGMEGAGSEHYDVVAFTHDGARRVYRRE